MRWQGTLAAIVCSFLLALGAAETASADVPDATLRGAFAVAPPSAPASVKAMIAAGNRIRHKRYLWGGGHVNWWSPKGYDCSGSVSYVLHAGGLLDYPLVSGDLAHWGAPGAGAWVRIYANDGHVFAVIAGLRWDTSFITDGDRTGPGWSLTMRPTRGFRLRHPTGVEHATPLG